MTAEWLPSLAKAAADQGLLTQLYGDLAKPGVSQVGKALSTVLGLGNTLLWPVQLLNERTRLSLEANLDSYRNKMSQIPEDKVAEIPPEVGVPIAEKLAYVSDINLRELYITLLAKASNSETQSQAHPSFVNLLNNMSPDEAQLVRQFERQGGSIPFVTAKYVNPQTNGWIEVVDVHFSVHPETKLTFPDNLPAYVSNLESLGLIDVRRDIYINNEDLYTKLTSQLEAQYKDMPRFPALSQFRCEKGKIVVTRFGWLFIQACVT
jgi:hypothetical protein